MRTLLFLPVLILAAACGTSKNATGDHDVISILHGTSYGHCRGYCITEELYTADGIVFTQYSRDSANYPKKEMRDTYTAEELQALAATIDMSTWKALAERIGCPDCADGGAEYIEIRTKTGTKRVTFEAHSDPEGLAETLVLLRAKRRAFEKTEENGEE